MTDLSSDSRQLAGVQKPSFLARAQVALIYTAQTKQVVEDLLH